MVVLAHEPSYIGDTNIRSFQGHASISTIGKTHRKRDAAETSYLILGPTVSRLSWHTNILSYHPYSISKEYFFIINFVSLRSTTNSRVKNYLSVHIRQIETLFHFISKSPYRLSAHVILPLEYYEYCSLIEHYGSITGNDE